MGELVVLGGALLASPDAPLRSGCGVRVWSASDLFVRNCFHVPLNLARTHRERKESTSSWEANSAQPQSLSRDNR